MNRAMHATLARTLITIVGGLDAALEIIRLCDNRRTFSKPKLSDYQNPHATACMPADIIGCLESHCGQAIYSRRLFEQTEPAVGDLREDACQAVEDVASFMGLARQLAAKGPLSPRMQEELRKLLIAAEEDLVRVGADIDQMGGVVTPITRSAA